MEGKISDSQLVTIITLWSNVNHYGQKPIVVEGEELQQLSVQHGLQEALADNGVDSIEKRIYAFTIEQPHVTPTDKSYDISDDEEDAPGALHQSGKVLFNVLNHFPSEVLKPLHSFTKDAARTWKVIVPSFYLTRHDKGSHGIELVPEVGLTPQERMYEYFLTRRHPFALPFPNRNNSDVSAFGGLNCGKKYAPGVLMHDVYRAQLKSLGEKFKLYKLVESYVMQDFPQFERQAKALNDFRVYPKFSELFIAYFKNLLFEFDITETLNSLLKINKNIHENSEDTIKSCFLLDVLFGILTIRHTIILIGANQEHTLKVDIDDLDLNIFIASLEKLAFNSFAKAVFPKGIPKDISIDSFIKVPNEPTAQKMIAHGKSLIEEYNQVHFGT